jgi:Tol biopolymer transport system component
MFSHSHGKRTSFLGTLVVVLAIAMTLVGVSDASADSATGTLSVRVGDALTEKPIVGATVSVQTWYGVLVSTGQTDARGAYQVTLSRGIYRVGATANGYRATSRWAFIRGGQTSVLGMLLQPTPPPPPPTPTSTPTTAPLPPTPTSTPTTAPLPPTPTPTPTLTPTPLAPPPPPPVAGQPKITFASQGGTYDVLTINPDGSGATDLTPNTPGSSEHDPAWSPDRSRIVFASDVTGVNYLYLVNADGTGLRQLTTGFGTDIQPAWSPDGTQIAFISRRADLWFQVHVMNADGTNIRALTGLVTIQQNPNWAPDSRRLAFQCGSALCLINADGSGLQTWFSSSINSGKPDWSPDGRRIAFAFDGGIWLRNADGTAATRLIDGFDPAWSPDGSQIVFVRREALGGYEHLWRINVDGTGLVQLTTGITNDIRPDW